MRSLKSSFAKKSSMGIDGHDNVAQATEFSEQSSVMEAMLALNSQARKMRVLTTKNFNKSMNHSGGTKVFLDTQHNSVETQHEDDGAQVLIHPIIEERALPAVIMPIPQVGFPKITPKFLSNYERIQEKQRLDRDRLVF